MVILEQELKSARDSLLDLTMRNRLLNYRASKTRTIRVVDEIPTEIFEYLVINEKAMQFLPLEEKPAENNGEQSNVGQNGETSLTPEDATIIWQAPAETKEVVESHTDHYLQTNLEPELLQKRLFYVHQQANAVFEEQGYSVLFLAMGFLQWTESNQSDQPRKAPLILIPVELERTKVNQSFRLRWTGEDISTNISLQAKLKEQGISLPELDSPETKEEIDAYFQDVTNAIKKMPSWNIAMDIYLDFFSFSKFVMYKDLDPIAWPGGSSPLQHPLIQAILDPSSTPTQDSGFDESDIDQKLKSPDLFHTVDADPSQIAAIEDVKAGRNIIVEGPPGTGKSQTITNLIGELLAAGKSVLFVSEKMAALEVVKTRLDKVGLGDFCLELHSRKSNKKDVLKELERSIRTTPTQPSPPSEKYDQIENLKEELNGYVSALRTPFGKLQRSPFALICTKAKTLMAFDSKEKQCPSIDLKGIEECDSKTLSTYKDLLSNLEGALPIVQPIENNPWIGCEPPIVFSADLQRYGNALNECLQKINSLLMNIENLARDCAVKQPETFKELTEFLSIARFISKAKKLDETLLSHPKLINVNKDVDQLLSTLRDFSEVRKALSGKFEPSAYQYPVEQSISEYSELSGRFFKLLSPQYWRKRGELKTLYKERRVKKDAEIIDDLKRLKRYSDLLSEIKRNDDEWKKVFQGYWEGQETDTKALEEIRNWVIEYNRLKTAGWMNSGAEKLISSGLKKEEIYTLLLKITDELPEIKISLQLLMELISSDDQKSFGSPIDDIKGSKLVGKLEAWKNGLGRLENWSQFVSLYRPLKETPAWPIVELILNGQLSSGEFISCLESNLASYLLAIVLREKPQLGSFIGDLHLNKIQRFSELDRELIRLNRHKLYQKLFNNRPTVMVGASSGSEVGILVGEFNRQRRHMPIRKLLSKTGGLIQKIKPCFMMSPLSIAQFLDPTNIRFDVVIFDEASQVKPADALGAILRAKQLSVMGDSRQLPPTNFFDHLVESEEEEDEYASLSDMESILQQCKRCFPSKELRWHYRSRHESLVAVSNQEFYENRLLIYPSSIDKSADLGLQFVHIPDSIYDRGRSSTNRIEAKRVAQAAVEHYRKNPDKSLGIGTFNIKQQQAILEEIELQLRLNPDIQDLFHSSRDEHFFVKNLETIQGDERDVIFLSVGFGFDSNRQISLNFGPLNHMGGERRLNVLITRAREKCVVFSNFKASDLKLEHNSPMGLKALKVFLEYAENRSLASAEPLGDDADSPFEDAVYKLLTEKGFQIRKQVGCASYRVDLAVVDPKSPGRYVLGVECDGARYHSSPVARDRDRLRQQILEDLGWRLFRVWSTDWFRNRKETESKILAAVEKAVKEPNNGTPRKNVHEPYHPIPHANPSVSGSADSIPAEKQVDLSKIVEDYQCCKSLSSKRYGELHDQPSSVLMEAVKEVVAIESPMHIEELVRRIRSLWGLKRSGQRIQEAINRAVDLGDRKGAFRKKGNFVWDAGMTVPNVRSRKIDPLPDIELIADEEIAETIKIVLKHQFATLTDDLIVQSSRLLGFQATHEPTSKKIGAVIAGLIRDGVLEQMANGMIRTPLS